MTALSKHPYLMTALSKHRAWACVLFMLVGIGVTHAHNLAQATNTGRHLHQGGGNNPVSDAGQALASQWAKKFLLVNGATQSCLTSAPGNQLALEPCKDAHAFQLQELTGSAPAVTLNVAASTKPTTVPKCVTGDSMSSEVTMATGAECNSLANSVMLAPSQSPVDGFQVMFARGPSGLCLAANASDTPSLLLADCNPKATTQSWQLCKSPNNCLDVKATLSQEAARQGAPQGKPRTPGCKKMFNSVSNTPPGWKSSNDAAVKGKTRKVRILPSFDLTPDCDLVEVSLGDGSSVTVKLLLPDTRSLEHRDAAKAKASAAVETAVQGINSTEPALTKLTTRTLKKAGGSELPAAHRGAVQAGKGRAVSAEVRSWSGYVVDEGPDSSVVITQDLKGRVWSMSIRSRKEGLVVLGQEQEDTEPDSYTLTVLDESKIKGSKAPQPSNSPGSDPVPTQSQANLPAGRKLLQDFGVQDRAGVVYVAAFWPGELGNIVGSVQGAIARTNAALSRAGAPFYLHLFFTLQVGSDQYRSNMDDSISMHGGEASYCSQQARNVRADLMLLVVPDWVSGANGVAYVPGIDDIGTGFKNAISVVKAGVLGSYIPAHELGHNLGLQHNREDPTSASSAIRSYAYGPWAVVPGHCVSFSTWCWDWHYPKGAVSIMSYDGECNKNSYRSCDRVEEYGATQITVGQIPSSYDLWGNIYWHSHSGVQMGDGNADPGRVFREVGPLYSQYRKHGCDWMDGQQFDIVNTIGCWVSSDISRNDWGMICEANGLSPWGWRIFQEPCYGVTHYSAGIACFARNSDVRFVYSPSYADWGSASSRRRCCAPTVISCDGRPPRATLPTAQSGGQCGPGVAVCGSNQCCSKWGWCGVTSAHCAATQGCQSNYGTCW